MSDETEREMPPTWWSPSERTWFSQDREGEYYEIYSEEAILELPSDAVNLVAAGDGAADGELA